MFHDIKKIYRSFRFAFKGLAHAYRNDRSFALEINWGLPLYVLVGFLLSPMQPVEWMMFIGSYMLILIVELINTAYETMLARVHPDHHEVIGRGKDISAAAVAMAFLFAVIVVGILIWERIDTFHSVWS